jgi:V8-like Glu-specific endopeptidase
MPVDKLNRADWPMTAMVLSYFPTLRNTRAPYTVGSATLIDPKAVVTAAHVIYDPDRGGWADMFDIYFGDGTSTRVEGAQGRVRSEWINEGTTSTLSLFDAGVIKLEQPASPRPAVPRSSLLDNLLGVPINVLGYPADPLVPNLYGYLAGARTTAIRQGVASNEARVAYPVYTYDGMSGGPLLRTDEIDSANGTFLLRGVHTSLFNNQGNGLTFYPSLFDQIMVWAA